MIRVLLVQLPAPNNPATNVPLAAGYLKAYAQAQGLLDQVEIDILPRRIADTAGDALLVETIIARPPDVLGFSLYTWNSERSLAIAERVKQCRPGILVVGGGPEVQPDNAWLLQHPALDIGVIGEGEQTFAVLLRRVINWRSAHGDAAGQSFAAERSFSIDNLNGLVVRRGDELLFTPARVALDDLAVIPSPYLAGYLELAPNGIAMVEVSRWCPYACSFCLYGRNVGAKLGRRYFGIERVLAEIAWAKAQGATAIHFVEANLNLVPFFRPLMSALADLNADHALAFYAELRGEYLNDAVVAAMVRAGLRVAEVGLQTANPVALAASQRRTDLCKWAAGTRRLLDHGVEVLLDVILGLPEDDVDGVRETLDFIWRENLAGYDIFTLQVLPGTTVRREAARFGIVYQERPPYYVLGTDRMSYTTLRELRRELKLGVGLAPDAIEGLPEPRRDALVLGERDRLPVHPVPSDTPLSITRLDLADAGVATSVERLAIHVDILTGWEELVAATGEQLSALIRANPSTLFDLYVICSTPPDAETLRTWRAALPYQPGYLDRVAVYQRAAPESDHQRVSPRIWLVLPWTAQAEPQDYAFCAEIIWRYDLVPGEEAPLGAWRGAGGAGVWAPGASPEQAAAWEAATGLWIWR
jgi:radical SAM superfamily enzyme YgiQ (UPF0313 family)